MFTLEYATEDDFAFWRTLDTHIADGELRRKLRDKRCYLLKADGATIGVLRYNLFWDSIPFLTLLFLREDARGKGFGTGAMRLWEMEMRYLQYSAVMTSTQADESAQHFYRKLGYRDAGCLILDQPPLRQPAELFFVKML